MPRILGHGIDLVEVQRVARLLDEHGERFLTRCYTPAEADYARTAKRRPEHLAARLAAKEAVLKALGTGLTRGISWTDIEITRSADGAPGVQLSGPALDVARSLHIDRWLVSLTHTAGIAAASVIALGDDEPRHST